MPVLDVIVYDTAKVGGPVNAPHPGAFSNPNEWYRKSCP